MAVLTSKQHRRVNLLGALREWEASGRSKKDFAGQVDISPAFLSQLLSGHREIGDASARKIERGLGLETGMLDGFNARYVAPAGPRPVEDGESSGFIEPTPLSAREALELVEDDESSLRDGYTIIPRYDLWASAGTGNHVGSEPAAAHGDAFRTAFVRGARWSPTTHFSMRVRGDSMIEAGLRDGWSVVVNSTETLPEPGEIYLINFGGQIMAKYLETLPGGGLRVISANSSHPAYRVPLELTPEQAEDLKVLGRVVFMQGKTGRGS